MLLSFSGLIQASSAMESLPMSSDELQGRNLEEEHESNGPEGAPGIPMQRMPLKGMAFVLVTVLGSGALVWRTAKEANTSKPTQ